MNQNPADLLVDEKYLVGSAAACGYIEVLAARILWEVGFGDLQQRQQPLPTAALGISPALGFALAWLLEEASHVEAVRIEEEPGGPILYTPLEPPTEALFAARREALEQQAAVGGSSLETFDFVAARYKDYLRGQKSGVSILLKGEGLRFWESYFAKANPLYDIHNELGWLGLAEAIRRLGREVSAAELGTGTGGGTDAILRGVTATGETRLSGLTLTDIAPSLLVNTLERMTQAYPDGPPLARRRLDFSRPFAEQGLLAGSFDVMVAVNALHNAPDLVKMLENLREELPPDGFLIISESICGVGAQVHQDFIFNLFPLNHSKLESENTVSRRHSRFLHPALWQEALGAAGFTAEVYVNSLGPELALLAIARKPS